MYTNIPFGPIEKNNDSMWCNVTRPKGMQDTDLLCKQNKAFSFANSTNMSSKSYQLQTKSEVIVFIMIRV